MDLGVAWPMSLTVAVSMPADERAELVRWTRSASLRAGLAQRPWIVLSDQGLGTKEIAERGGVSKPSVIAWKQRYAAAGIADLEGLPKPCRPAQVDGAFAPDLGHGGRLFYAAVGRELARRAS